MESKRIYTTQIKQNNINLVKSVLRADGAGTKLSVAASTGLSVSTCNTLLNHLLSIGELIEVPNPYNHIGRPAKAYGLNPDYAHSGCILLLADPQQPQLVSAIYNLRGDQLYRAAVPVPQVRQELLPAAIADLRRRDARIRRVAIGVPGIVSRAGHILYCDAPELTGWRITEELEAAHGCQILIENDVNAIAYGLKGAQADGDGATVVANFSHGVCPGCGIVMNGKIVRGQTNFAGEISYQFPRASRQQQILALSDPATQLPLICSLLLSVITVINPASIYLTGDLFTQPLLEQVTETCLQYVSQENLPSFLLLSDSTSCYLNGLLELTLSRQDLPDPEIFGHGG